MSPKTRHIETVTLPSASPGTQRQFDVIHYGASNQGPKAYLQAALHADEIPGLLVLHKLIRLLDKADKQGEICGQVVLVPIANPIGSAQNLFGELAGRYEQSSGTNFNRDFADLSQQVIERIGVKLGDDAKQNTLLIRDAAKQILTEKTPLNETAVLKNKLLVNAIDADIVIDLHCDWKSVMHLYTTPSGWPEARDLAAYLGALVVLLESTSGGNPFDEAISGLWWALSKAYPDKPIEQACMATTVELRGKTDVDEQQAEQDAQALFHYLQSKQVIKGTPPRPPVLKTEASPLAGVEQIIAPHAAVVSYNKAPGERVKPGEVVCTLFDVSQYGDEARIELKASVEGVLYAHRLDYLCRPGQVLCRIAGKDVIAEPGGLLLVD